MRKILALALAASAIATVPCVNAQDPKSELEKRLSSEFTLTKTTAQWDDIVTAGSILLLHKDGLTMFTVNSRVPAPCTYKDGKISITFADAMAATLMLGNNQTASTVPQRKFVSGEKFWLIGTKVSDKNVILQVFSDPFGDTRYFAQIKFPFAKHNIPSPDEMMKTISEVVTVQPQDTANTDQNAQPADTPSSQEPPKTISIGQTTDEVIAVLGQPQKKVNLGAKEIYVYPDMKVTFVNGKVADVQ